MRNTVAAPQPIKEKSFSGERAYLSNMIEPAEKSLKDYQENIEGIELSLQLKSKEASVLKTAYLDNPNRTTADSWHNKLREVHATKIIVHEKYIEMLRLHPQIMDDPNIKFKHDTVQEVVAVHQDHMDSLKTSLLYWATSKCNKNIRNGRVGHCQVRYDTGDYPCSMCETYINAVNKYMEIKESLEK